MTSALKQLKLLPHEFRPFMLIITGIVVASILAAALVSTFFFTVLNLDPGQLSGITDGFRAGLADRARGLQ